MKSVINEDVAEWMSENNYFYIMHRFGVDTYSFVKKANQDNWNTISISIGVKEEDEELIRKISSENLRVDYITIDIAHGHSALMEKRIKLLRQKASFCFGVGGCKIIAGNVAISQAVRELHSWGASAVKVGIGQGSPCTTKDKTGFTRPMFSSVLDCSGVYSGSGDVKVPIIADGGVSCTGDIAKAIRAGASMVMAGGMFAKCKDSPAKTVLSSGESFKAYFGSASAENKLHNNNIEGVQRNLKVSDLSYEDKLNEIEQDLQSSISYAGGGDLTSLSSVSYEIVT